MKHTAVLILGLLLWMPAAQAFNQSFTAEAIQTAPGMDTVATRLYVAKGKAVRMEVSTPRGDIIQQYFPASGLLRVIYPEQREYIEQKTPAPLALPGQVVTNPCDQMPDARCEKLGEEKIGQLSAVHWRISRQGPGNSVVTMEQWLDKQRGLPLRQLFPNGARIEASLAGRETVNGRDTERWEIVMTPASGEVQRGTQWHDVELDVTVREQLPNGSVRELRNIVLEEPAAALFAVPPGFQKREMPKQPPGGRP